MVGVTPECIGQKLSEMNISPGLQADGFLFNPYKCVLVFLQLKIRGTEHEKMMIAYISKGLKKQKK